MKTFLGILLATSVVLEVLTNTMAEYQRTLTQCATEQCRQEQAFKINLVQAEIDKANPTTTAAVTWADIGQAIIPKGGE